MTQVQDERGVDLCSLCERPMNPGQKRDVASDGRKAHSSCVALADQHGGIAELEDLNRIDEAVRVDEVRAITEAILDERLPAVIAEITAHTIPNKATALRRLLDHAADGLDRTIKAERVRSSYSSKIEPEVMAAMVEAQAMLRTVAIFIMDEP